MGRFSNSPEKDKRNHSGHSSPSPNGPRHQSPSVKKNPFPFSGNLSYLLSPTLSGKKNGTPASRSTSTIASLAKTKIMASRWHSPDNFRRHTSTSTPFPEDRHSSPVPKMMNFSNASGSPPHRRPVLEDMISIQDTRTYHVPSTVMRLCFWAGLGIVSLFCMVLGQIQDLIENAQFETLTLAALINRTPAEPNLVSVTLFTVGNVTYYFCILGFVLETLGKLFQKQWDILLLWFNTPTGHAIVLGTTSESFAVAYEMLGLGVPTVLIVDKNDYEVRQLRERGVYILMEGTSLNEGLLNLAQIQCASCLFAFHDDTQINIGAAYMVANMLDHDKRDETLDTWIRVQNFTEYNVDDLVEGADTELQRIHVCDIQLSAARFCLRKHHPHGLGLVPMNSDDNMVHAVIIGFSTLGASLAQHMIATTHFSVQMPLNITIIEEDYTKYQQLKRFAARYASLKRFVIIKTIHTDFTAVRAHSFDEAYRDGEGLLHANSIYICNMDDPVRSIHLGIQLQASLMSPSTANVVICVKSIKSTSHQAIFEYFSTKKNLKIFGIIDDTLKAGQLVYGYSDILAQVLYNEKSRKDESRRPWDELLLAEKYNYHVLADNMSMVRKPMLERVSKVSLASYDVKRIRQVLDANTDNIVELMAKADHARWLFDATARMNCGSFEKTPIENYMVPFDQLPEHYKEKTERNVLLIPRAFETELQLQMATINTMIERRKGRTRKDLKTMTISSLILRTILFSLLFVVGLNLILLGMGYLSSYVLFSSSKQTQNTTFHGGESFVNFGQEMFTEFTDFLAEVWNFTTHGFIGGTKV
eukprot:m.180104 g.180104  ORF g.180104 m.180104 type:complete len:814 (-) comp15491_c0_seq5:540-2981(-)